MVTLIPGLRKGFQCGSLQEHNDTNEGFFLLLTERKFAQRESMSNKVPTFPIPLPQKRPHPKSLRQMCVSPPGVRFKTVSM